MRTKYYFESRHWFWIPPRRAVPPQELGACRIDDTTWADQMTLTSHGYRAASTNHCADQGSIDCIHYAKQPCPFHETDSMVYAPYAAHTPRWLVRAPKG